MPSLIRLTLALLCLQSLWLQSSWLQSSWLQSLGLQSLGLQSLGQGQALADELAEPAIDELAPPASIRFTTPSGWALLPGLSQKVATTASQTEYFQTSATAGESSETGALAYGRANRGALYLTWVDTQAAHPVPAEAIRTAFDGLHEAPFLAAAEAGAAQEIQYRERRLGNIAELAFEWAHMNNDTLNLVRALAWTSANGRLHLAIAECVLHNESVGESRPLCEAALASLALNPAAQPATLRALAPPKIVGSIPPDQFTVPELTTGDSPSGATLGLPPTQPGEVLYTGRPPAKEGNSNRLLIGIGVLLLGAAVWLTTRSQPGEDSADTDSEREDHDAEETPE